MTAIQNKLKKTLLIEDKELRKTKLYILGLDVMSGSQIHNTILNEINKLK